jgi:hypothetical protein
MVADTVLDGEGDALEVLEAVLDAVLDGEDDALGVLEAELDGDGDGEVVAATWPPTVKSTCATPLKATEEVRSTRTMVQLPARTSHRPANAPDPSVRSGADQVPGVRSSQHFRWHAMLWDSKCVASKPKAMNLAYREGLSKLQLRDNKEDTPAEISLNIKFMC